LIVGINYWREIYRLKSEEFQVENKKMAVLIIPMILSTKNTENNIKYYSFEYFLKCLFSIY
jgi:hypothetical protein